MAQRHSNHGANIEKSRLQSDIPKRDNNQRGWPARDPAKERRGVMSEGNGNRIVVTKHRTYHIADDVERMPIEEYMPDTNLPEDLKGAKVYL